ncbi:GFA family protein [Chitinibacteraceae bacterium HSL-7]
MRGSCLCRSVVYEVSQLDSDIQHCACQTCRKAHAAAFNSGARVLHSHFRWVQGYEHLRHFESSPGKKRFFCGQCGSHLVAQRDGRNDLMLRVATLDDDPGTQPVQRIWNAHAAPWLNGDGISVHEGAAP